MRAIIILNGEINEYNVVRAFIKPEDVIFVADGGIRHLGPLNTEANYIMGDFDSSNELLLESCIRAKKVSYPTDKNFTDGELVVLEVLAHKDQFDEVLILGALGGRMDHMMSNVSLLKRLYENDVSASICDEINKIRYIESDKEEVEIQVYKACYKYLSIIPLSKKMTVTNLDNVKYPLKDKKIEYGSTLCTSNEIIDEKMPATICIKEGRGLVIQSIDKS